MPTRFDPLGNHRVAAALGQPPGLGHGCSRRQNHRTGGSDPIEQSERRKPEVEADHRRPQRFDDGTELLAE